MRVLDTTFLIDYLDGVEGTQEYYERNGAETERWVIPVPGYAEVLVGAGNLPQGDVARTRAARSWGEKYQIDEKNSGNCG